MISIARPERYEAYMWTSFSTLPEEIRDRDQWEMIGTGEPVQLSEDLFVGHCFWGRIKEGVS